MKNAYQKYKTTSVTSASKEKILLMLYEGAIKFTKRAIIACEEKNIAERGMNIGKAFDIIMELNNTLDHKVGGGSIEPLKEALGIIETLHSAWVKAVEQVKKIENSNTESEKR
jgi:flagellar protein FliS